MAGGSDGYRAALVRRQLTPGLISSLPGTAGLRAFISSSTSYPEALEHRRRAHEAPQRDDRVADRTAERRLGDEGNNRVAVEMVNDVPSGMKHPCDADEGV